MHYILGFLWKMLPWAAGALCLYLPIRGLWLWRRSKRSGVFRLRPGREAALLLFWMLLTAVSSQTVFRSLPTFSLSHFGKPLNLIPGQVFTLARESLYGLAICLVGNIAVFLPMGFFPPLLWSGADLRRTLFFGGGLSLAYELLQLPLDRSTDIDDLLLNLLGTAIGFALALLLRQLCPRLRELQAET